MLPEHGYIFFLALSTVADNLFLLSLIQHEIKDRLLHSDTTLRCILHVSYISFSFYLNYLLLISLKCSYLNYGDRDC